MKEANRKRKRTGAALAVLLGMLVFLGTAPTNSLARERYEEKFEKTFSLAKDGKVFLGNISGDIEVKTWNRNEVKVSALKSTRTDSQEQANNNFSKVEIKITEERNSLRIETKYAKNYFRGKNKNCSVQYWLTIPSGADIDANSVSGDVIVEEIGGAARANTVSGEVTMLEIGGFTKGKSVSGSVKITGARQAVDADSVSGDIVVKGSGGDADMKTVSGNILAEKIKGDIDAETVSGKVELQDVTEAKSVEAKSLSGSVEYYGRIYENGVYHLQSHSGRVVMEIPGNSAFDLEAKSFSGSINTDFELTISGKLSRRSLRGTVNGGGADVELKTFSGSVHLRKR